MATEQQLILEDIPDSLAVCMVKSIALEQGRLVKRVRRGTAQTATYEGTEEPEGMADAPIERLLKDIINKQAPEVIQIESPKKPSVKKKPPRKLAIKKRTLPCTAKKTQPSTSGYKTPSLKTMPKGPSPATKKTLKAFGWKEGDDSSKGGTTGKKKIRKANAEKLKEVVWKAWEKQLDYETDSD